MVHPGDFVFADLDGVVVVPKGIVREVMDLAADKVASREQLPCGADAGCAYLRDVFAKYQVL